MEAVLDLLAPYKVCSCCGLDLPCLKFQRDPSKKHGVTTFCRGCKLGHEPDVRRAQRGRGRHHTGLINWGEYEGMVEAQDGLCAICGRPETTRSCASGEPRRLSVDHDHVTGQVRGLLCHGCNVAIGHFGDDVEVLLSAVRYLEGPR